MSTTTDRAGPDSAGAGDQGRAPGGAGLLPDGQTASRSEPSAFDPSREHVELWVDDLREAMNARRNAKVGSDEPSKAWDQIAALMCSKMRAQGPLFGDYVVEVMSRVAPGTEAGTAETGTGSVHDGPIATGEAPASTSDADGDLARLSAATKAECVLLAGSIRQDLGKLADAHGDLANDLDDTCDRIVDRVLAFLAARKLPTAVGVTPAVADITQRRCAGIRKAWEAGSWPDEGGISFLLRHAEARVADLVSRSTPPQAVPAQGGVTVGWVLVPEEATEAMWQAGREADEHPGDSYSAAWAAMIAAAPQPDSPAPRAEEPHEGWLYHNPDTGEEWSLNHPVESGEVEDAENIRPATAAILKDMLIQAWDDAEERRGENEEAAQEISRLRDALRRATAPASPDSPAPVASGGEREALVVQAIDAFQKRNGYHKPVILELLEEFGSLLLALATAPHQPATEAAPSPAGMVEEALKGAMRAFLDERDRWADSRFPYGDERHAYFTLGNLRRLCKAYEALLAHPQEVPAPDQGWQPIKMAPGDGAPVLVGWAGTGFEATKAHCEAGIWGTLDQDMTFRPLDRQPDVFRELPISPLNLPTPPASTEA